MVIASAMGTIASVVVLFTHGWLPGLGLFLLSVIAFAMSRVFDLLADLMTSVGRLEESKSQGDQRRMTLPPNLRVVPVLLCERLQATPRGRTWAACWQR